MLQEHAGVAEWQTQQIQNLPVFTGRAGSSPASGTKEKPRSKDLGFSFEVKSEM